MAQQAVQRLAVDGRVPGHLLAQVGFVGQRTAASFTSLGASSLILFGATGSPSQRSSSAWPAAVEAIDLLVRPAVLGLFLEGQPAGLAELQVLN